MTRLLAGFSLLMFAVSASAPAQAKGCIKGALIGGTAGHFAGHHGVIGALAGCAIGRHEANKRAQPNAPQSSYGQAQGDNQPFCPYWASDRSDKSGRGGTSRPARVCFGAITALSLRPSKTIILLEDISSTNRMPAQRVRRFAPAAPQETSIPIQRDQGGCSENFSFR
jgi:hypothetical protein